VGIKTDSDVLFAAAAIAIVEAGAGADSFGAAEGIEEGVVVDTAFKALITKSAPMSCILVDP